MSYLWGSVNVLQLLTYLALTSVNIPGLPRVANVIIMQISQLDILPSQTIIQDMYMIPDENNIPGDMALNEYFNQAGFQSSYSIVNMGSTFIYLLLYLAFVLIQLLLNAVLCCDLKYYLFYSSF